MPLPSSCIASPPAGHTRPSLRVHGPHDPSRVPVEAFIHQVFAARFGAKLQQFAPMLVSLGDSNGLLAAAGYRPAEGGALFLERYLDAPVEALLAGPAGQAPGRQGIVEVGHLAAARAGEGRRLIHLLGPHLAAQGFQWVVSTLTDELRRLFLRIGVAPLALGEARADALGDAAADWGRYYDHRPVVLAGQLQPALHRLRQRAQATDGELA